MYNVPPQKWQKNISWRACNTLAIVPVLHLHIHVTTSNYSMRRTTCSFSLFFYKESLDGTHYLLIVLKSCLLGMSSNLFLNKQFFSHVNPRYLPRVLPVLPGPPPYSSLLSPWSLFVLLCFAPDFDVVTHFGAACSYWSLSAWLFWQSLCDAMKS